tara:strand:- start:14789 stop:15952 length:1164 start_codon:yes stop_codon:yes gene_type:complete
MQIRNNIIKMHLLKGVTWFMVAMPIIVLFFQEHGLTITQVMVLQSIYSLSVAFFEIPSGYIADLFGRKRTIVFSTIFTFIGYLIFSFYGEFHSFAIAQILVGIGGSLMSGSDSALIYDTLIEKEEEGVYTKIEGRNYAIGNFSEATAGILGGFLAVSSIYLPIYIQTCILFLSIPIALTLVEPTIHRKDSISRPFNTISDIIKFTFLINKKLKWLIIYSSAMGVATLSMAWFAQPFFKQIDMPLAYYGVLWAGLNFSAGITSYNAHRLLTSNNYKYLSYNSLIIIISFISLGMTVSLYGLLFIFIIYLSRGFITPALRNAININTTSEKRATVLSIRSFVIRISFAAIAPLLGYIGENYSLTASFYLLGITVGIFSLLSAYKISRLD